MPERDERGERDERAILNPRGGDGRFTLVRIAPSAWLAPFVERLWIVRWRLDEPFQQETLPNPLVNVVLGHHQAGIWGPQQRRFVADLDGAGWVVGAKFHAGGFHPFLGADLATIANVTLPLTARFAPPSLTALEDAGDAALAAALEAMLHAAAPKAPDANLALARRAVELVQADVAIARCDQLAAHLDLTLRGLERLFHRFVGLPAKSVIRRARIQEACERTKSGHAPSWSQLAGELGYFDQSHFIRDFKAQVGRTPAEYAALCAASTS